MKKMCATLNRYLTKIILAIMALFVLLLCISAFIFTSYADNMETQVALIRRDNLFINILGLLLLYGIFIGISIYVFQNAKKRKSILLILVLVWYLGAGLFLAVFGRTVPAADAMSVYSMAEELAGGNTSVIHPTDSYISYYPQQIGLVGLYEVCIRVWNLFGIPLAAFHFLKCLNVCFACFLIFFQYQTVHILFQNDRTDCLYLCLAGANLPLLFYTSFVYGEIPSLTFFFLGLWLLLQLDHAAGRKYFLLAVLSSLAFGCSVLLRKNMLIPLIAVILLLLLQNLRLRKVSLLLITLSLCLTSYLLPQLTERWYEYRSGNEIAQGVPPLSYVAMGMQEASRGSGWYNGYNIETYQRFRMNTTLTNEASIADIQASLAQWQSQPVMALRFYGSKFLTQWTDGTYACRQATLATFGGRTPLIQNFYDGIAGRLLIELCNAYQNLLYLGCLLYTAAAYKWSRKKSHAIFRENDPVWPNLLILVGLLAAVGGFMFHMVWEANSRYIFPYAVLLLPYGARGLSLCRPVKTPSKI